MTFISDEMIKYIFKANDTDEFNRRIYCLAVYINKKFYKILRGENK